MSAPQVPLQLTDGRARLYGSHHVISNTVVFLHLAGTLLANS